MSRRKTNGPTEELWGLSDSQFAARLARAECYRKENTNAPLRGQETGRTEQPIALYDHAGDHVDVDAVIADALPWWKYRDDTPIYRVFRFHDRYRDRFSE